MKILVIFLFTYEFTYIYKIELILLLNFLLGHQCVYGFDRQSDRNLGTL